MQWKFWYSCQDQGRMETCRTEGQANWECQAFRFAWEKNKQLTAHLPKFTADNMPLRKLMLWVKVGLCMSFTGLEHPPMILCHYRSSSALKRFVYQHSYLLYISFCLVVIILPFPNKWNVFSWRVFIYQVIKYSLGLIRDYKRKFKNKFFFLFFAELPETNADTLSNT